jgi:hypothetical protein
MKMARKPLNKSEEKVDLFVAGIGNGQANQQSSNQQQDGLS